MDLIGSLNNFNHPIFTIKVFGFSEKNTISVNAMLDTGFSGFLSLPLADCLRTGLILYSTATYTLADGSIDSALLCLGTIFVPTKKVIGAISISKDTNALLGMEFLKNLNATLHLSLSSKIVKISF